jgi:hypothetical protein
MNDRDANIVNSWLLVMQSKRLVLSSNQLQLKMRDADAVREKVELATTELARAETRYRDALLGHGSPANPAYWPTAYGRLANLADGLAHKLTAAAAGSEHRQRYDLSLEVELLEELASQWRDSLRASIQGAPV